MSLFKVKDFWIANCDGDETFDQNCLKVSKIVGEDDSIITGSHSGVLRIFRPSTGFDDNITLAGYKPTDLLIEKKFADPILQLQTGKLVSGSTDNQIAVLHSNAVKIYKLLTKEGETEHGTQYILKLTYEHKLKRASWNFLVGPFGKTINRDFICVQSLDGMLTFFEQESFAFCCFLPNFLLPGPLIYVPNADCFITAGSTWNLHCFSYKNLSDAGEDSTQEDISGKKAKDDWAFNVGEDIFELLEVSTSVENDSFILALGQRTLFCFDTKGKLKFMKRLECPSSCLYGYFLEDENKIVSLIVSETKILFIYGNTTLMWAAQLPFLPVALSRAFFSTVRGALVMLGEDGTIHCSYLGTDPQLFTAPPLTNQELDLDKAEEELSRLYKIIRSRFDDVNKAAPSLDQDLLINIKIDPHLESNIHPPSELNGENFSSASMCRVTVELTPHAVFEEVQLSIIVRTPLKASKETEYFSRVHDLVTFESDIYVERTLEIISLDLKVVVTCISNVMPPRVMERKATLPLKLVAQTCEPQKDGEHKVTLNLNKEAVPISQLFPDFIGEGSVTLSSNVVAFRNITGYGEPVTIMLARTSQRYRIQSNSFASLSLFITYIKERLQEYYTDVKDFQVTYTSSLPVAPVVEYLKAHFEAMQKTKTLLEKIEQLSSQYRLIEMRLISKFKDRNPTPLSKFEILIDDTFRDLSETAANLEKQNMELLLARNKLECALSLLINLVGLMDVSATTLQIIRSALLPYVLDAEGQSWEDTVDASLCYLLRTVLAKSEKDKLRTAHTSFEDIKDISKVEKHLTQVIERLSAGTENVVQEEADLEVNEEVRTFSASLKTIGNQYGESSLRALSARRSLLRKRHKVDENE